MNNAARQCYGLGRLGVRSLGALIIIFLVVNARWICLYRHGLALDIDECGYLSLSLIDYYGLVSGGLPGWLRTVGMPSIQAPVTTALSSLVYMVTGPHIIAAFMVPLAAGAGCVYATYILTRSLGSRGGAFAAALLTASCPVIINYSRSYHFSIPATLVTTMALVAVLRSRNFHSIGWAAIFGICLGLMPLTRTMTVAFIPGLTIGAFILVFAEQDNRFRRACTFAGAGILSVLVAATWLWSNGLLVANYLFNFGYGSRAAEYGPASSRLGIDAWQTMLQAFIDRDVYFPHVFIVFFGGFLTVIVAVYLIGRHGAKKAFPLILTSPVFTVSLFIFLAIVALTTSRNKGSAFFAPIMPAMFAVTAWAMDRVGGSRSGSLAFQSLVVAVALVAVGPLLDLRTPIAAQWVADMPIIGPLNMTDGRGTIQQYEANGGYVGSSESQPLDDATSRAWIDFNTVAAAALTRDLGPQNSVAFGFRNELFNVNSLNLLELLKVRSAFKVRQVEPEITGDTRAGYQRWLADEVADICVLLTSDQTLGDFLPKVDPTQMVEAAQQSDFVPVDRWTAPDGRIIQTWKHRVAPITCLK